MKRLLQNLLLVTVSALIGLGLVEVGLRLAGISFPLFYQYDALRGSALRPGAEGWYHNEGHAFVKISSDGLRDREHARAKPPGTYRVALLGDSMVEALQVNVEDAFWTRLEERLGACPALGGRPVEVINFGASGYSTAQEYITLREVAMAWAPDLVHLTFVVSNDVRDNSRALLGGNGDRPLFDLRDGQLVEDFSFRGGEHFRRGTSPVVRLLHATLNHVRVLQVLHEVWVRKRDGAFKPDVYTDPTLEPALYRPPPDARWREAWEITEALLGAMSTEARRGGARLAVSMASTPLLVDPDPAVPARYLAEHPGTALEYPEGRLAGVAAREGFDFVDIIPAMREGARREKKLLHGFANATPGYGHWNPDGHRLAGEALADGLCATLSTRPTPASAPGPASAPPPPAPSTPAGAR